MQNNFSTGRGTTLSLDFTGSLCDCLVWFSLFVWVGLVLIVLFGLDALFVWLVGWLLCLFFLLGVLAFSSFSTLFCSPTVGEASWGASQSKQPGSIASVATSMR